MAVAPRPNVLTQDQIQKIESNAGRLLSDVFETSDPAVPVNLNRVTKELGLAIKQGEFTSPEIDGFYDGPAKSIYVSSNAPYTRQSFTIAHEIGHHVLHQDVPKDTRYRNSEMTLSTEDKREEQQANWFAASLLMPRDIVEGYWRALPGDIRTIASIFRVSPLAMEYRLKNLGLL
jgi:Zn-dependent peptidase ImmA (M78 family)